MAKRLEIVTNVVLLAAAVSILIFNIRPLVSQPEVVGPAPPYKAGDRISETSELKFTGETFILTTASTCRFCTESMPFYRRLLESGARVVALTSEPIERNREYLLSHKVIPEAVLSVSANGLRFRGTPSLVLVDRNGIVQDAWWGKQNEKGEAEILARRKK